MSYNLSQTFYIDPNSVNNAHSIFLTGIDLYFKQKPKANNNSSGINNPGVQIHICETIQGAPNPSVIIPNSNVRKEYNEIFALNDASVATSFNFSHPISVDTGKAYAIIVKYDDNGYNVWSAKQGDTLLGTNTTFPGVSTGFQGKYYDYSNDGTWLSRSAIQLKFKVKVAKFTSNNITIELKDKNYEFITYDSLSGSFKGGESVFTDKTALTGTVSFSIGNNIITGTGTSFTNTFSLNTHVVVVSGNTRVLRKISSIVSDTKMSVSENFPITNTVATYFKPPVAKVYYQDLSSNVIYLSESTANSTNKFASNTILRGALSNATANVITLDNFSVNQFVPQILTPLPPNATANITYNFSYGSGNSFFVTPSFEDTLVDQELETITRYNALLMSRSNEVSNANNLYANDTSAIFKINLAVNKPSNNLFESPYLFNEKIDIFISSNFVNNDATNEHTRYGNAYSKHITSKVNFESGRAAEDLVAFATVYKPIGTDIKLYAKIYNENDPEAFDDKIWSPLILKDNSNNQTSSSSDQNDYIELKFGLPKYSETLTTVNGTITTTSNSSTITGSNTSFTTQISNNQVIKIYQPLFPDDYIISVVDAIANDTSLTIHTPITNNNVIGSGLLIDTLVFENAAFNNIMNDNVARYYNSSKTEFDTFDTFQLKIVLLSNNVNIVPRVNSLRAVGVSA